MKEYYASRAAEYDAVYRKPERQADLGAMQAWIPSRFQGRRVLEIACGTGWWTQFIAPVAASMHCIDAAAETLAIAATRVPADRVRLAVGDAWALPQGDFDGCFAGFWFSHIERARWGQFIEGVAGAVQPGARVMFIDNRYVEGSSTPLSDTDAAGDTWQTRRLADGSQHRVLKNFPTESEVRQLLAGRAQDVVWRCWDHYWALEYSTPVAPR